jgi:DNA adenine methylase
MKTPITYYGGKQRMVSTILPLIPEHEIYTEAFIGGGAIYWAKPKAQLEVINDLNGELINFYQVMKHQYDELSRLVQATLHSRKQHATAYRIYCNSSDFTPVERAWAVWVLSCQGFSGKIGSSWGYEKSKSTMTRKIQNAKYRFEVDDLGSRLEHTQIECIDALKVISVRDSVDTFHYVDPPYFNSNCGHYSGYSEQDFVNLLELLSGVKGKFLLSSYPSEVLEEFSKRNNWHTLQFKQKVAVSHKAVKNKIEVLTANYQI